MSMGECIRYPESVKENEKVRHAREDYNRIQDPLGEIGEDEPVFLLRAQDALAPRIVAKYAELAAQMGCQRGLIDSALAWEAEMRKWQRINKCKWPDIPVEEKDGQDGKI